MAKITSTFRAIINNYALFEIFILGILSGMPFSIIFTILLAMIRDMGVSLAIATSLAMAKLPYSAKFVWAPFIDGKKVPLLSQYGRRKSWMMLLTILNILLLTAITLVASKENFQIVLVLAICFSFCSASYDIAYDAWRIERVEKDLQAMGASIAIFAYRLGVLAISVGTMYIVELSDENWHYGFSYIIGLFSLGFLFILSVPDISKSRNNKIGFDFQKNIINPFKDFLTKPNALLILLAIVCYKAGEAMLAYISMPFIFDLGFSKIEWANVTKIFGFWATTFGTFAGGFICYKIGTLRGLLFCGIIQMVANLSYIWLSSKGHDINALIITIAIDNFTGGMGAASLVGYLGTLCNREYTATQYALLSSAATLANSTIVVYSGTLVEKMGWNNFFIFTIILSLPALLIFTFLIQKSRKAK